MPHSSGGGSSGGGFHGGGGFSGGGSSGGLFGGGESRRHSDTFFPGSYHYCYYHHGCLNSVYADYDLISWSEKWGLYIIGAVVCFILSAVILFNILPGRPKKINSDYYPQIMDGGHYIENSEELKESMLAFYKKTGIPIYLVTMESEERVNSLELQRTAYDMYLKYFGASEKEWLILYTESGETWWSFEGMQGNDTDDILTYSLTKTFNKTATNNLRQMEPGVAFAGALKEATKGSMKNWVEKNIDASEGLFVLAIAMFMFGIIYVCQGVKGYIYSKGDLHSVTERDNKGKRWLED